MEINTGDRERVAALLSGLVRQDVSGLSDDELLAGLEAAARLGRSIDTLQARLVAQPLASKQEAD